MGVGGGPGAEAGTDPVGGGATLTIPVREGAGPGDEKWSDLAVFEVKGANEMC